MLRNGKEQQTKKKGGIFSHPLKPIKISPFLHSTLTKLNPRMDMDSPDKAVDEIKDEDGSSLVDNPDLHLIGNKESERGENFMQETEVLNEGMQVYSDQEYSGLHTLQAGAENEALQSPNTKSNTNDFTTSDIKYEDQIHDDMERRISESCTDGQSLPTEDYQSYNKKDGAEGDLLDNNVNEVFSTEFQTEYSYSLPHNSLLTGNNSNNCYEMMGDEAFTPQAAKSPTLDETDNRDVENASTIFHNENAEVDTENGGMVWKNSSPLSPQRTENASPSPERPFSISAERSHNTHPSRGQGGVQSPSNMDKKLATSPIPARRKRSPSLEKRSGDPKRRSSRDQSSPSRQRSPERTTHRDSRHRDGSSRKHLAAPSPRRRESPQKRVRSLPQSPLRRRESPGHKRDRNHRSRSRSPYARDRYRRSPRRRQSPRRRSPPPSYSNRRSPRRPWSPPRNRNTGLGKPGNNLFVAGFSYVTTERDLEKKFSRYGRVTDVRIVRDRRSGESRGFGFLTLERDEDADAAIRAVDQTEWNGRIVLVEKSKTSTR